MNLTILPIVLRGFLAQLGEPAAIEIQNKEYITKFLHGEHTKFI